MASAATGGSTGRRARDRIRAWYSLMASAESAALPCPISRPASPPRVSCPTYDYRHLGTSEGEPRGLIDITRQRADYRAAIDLARRLGGIDHQRIALWGKSFGGGHVLATAARDHRLAAATIQNPFVDGPAAAAAAIRSSGRVHAYRLAWRAVRDKLHDRRGSDPLRVELAGPPGSVAMITTPDAVAGFDAILPADPVGFEPAVPAGSCCRCAPIIRLAVPIW